MKLYTHNYNGNLHETCAMINEHLPSLIEKLIHLEGVSGSLSIAVFRVTDEQYALLHNQSLYLSERYELLKSL